MSSDQGKQGLLSPYLQRRRVAAARPHLRGRVLDIGCGNGVLANFIAPADYLGMDRNPAVLARARALYPGHAFAEQLPEAAPVYDTVVSLAVIEHISYPAEAMTAWSKYLKPGGRMVLTTPHPAFEWIHEAGAAVGVFSKDAAEEHEEMIDRKRMEALLQSKPMRIDRYERFLFGVNQLFVLAPS
jgi:2-polyprenyl-3-methyl-5-hydroxy-6-metoxy-1,4-benzoquinol methylase